MTQGKLTTVKITTDTRDRLGQYGRKNETFDEIIIRLLDLAEEGAKSKK